MKGIIRWYGLGVFCSVLTIICLFTFFFVDGFVKDIIETQGSKMVGARVSLDNADLSFIPTGLELSGLQITDPDKPLRNIVEIDRLIMSIDTMKLLQRKIIIDEMALEGLRPDTPRKNSGAIPEYSARKKDSEPQEPQKSVEMPSLALPDVKEVLAREELTTIKLANDFQTQIKADTARWQQRLAELPNEESLAQYTARINKIKSSSGLAGILGGATDLLAVQKELRADLNRLTVAQREFSGLSTSYQNNLAELQKAPQQDIKRLSAKYSLSGNGLANLSALLFGSKADSVVGQGLAWYAKITPLLARNKEQKEDHEIVKSPRSAGVLVRFREDDPLPDFLIRTIAASIQVEQGSFAGTINNLTPDQDVLGIPLTFNFSGKNMQGLDAIDFSGIFDHINPNLALDTFNVEITGYSVAETTLSANENLAVAIESGRLDLSIQAILAQNNVNADVRADLQSVKFTTGNEKQDSNASQAIATALSGINNVSGKAAVTGTLANYQIKLSSDLDKILKQAMARTINDQTAKFEQKLKEGILAQVDGPLSAATSDFSALGNIAKELTDRLQTGGNLL